MPEPKKRGSEWPVRVTLWIALLALYVLSSGPMLYLRERGILHDGLFFTIYLPLYIAEVNCEPFHQALESYDGFWVP